MRFSVSVIIVCSLITTSIAQPLNPEYVPEKSFEEISNSFGLGGLNLLGPDDDTDWDGLTDWDEINIYHTRPNLWDSDGDGLSDGEEVLDFDTNPLRKSTDGDKYDDMMEIYGTNGTDDMPGYVLAPGDNVFVAAYPVIEIEVDENIYVEPIDQITFVDGYTLEETQEYSVAETTGSSYSVASTEAYTTGGWKETSNSEEDRRQESEYTDQISTSEEKYWTGYSIGTKTEAEIGTEVGVSTVGAYAKVNASVKNTLETGEYGDDYRGQTNTARTGGAIETEKVRKSSSTHGTKQESTFSTTVTKTSYNETTLTNTEAIAKGRNWETATTVDSENAAQLSFSFEIVNVGTDIAQELKDLQFNIFIGGRLSETVFSGNKTNVKPGDSIPVEVDVIITLEELATIDNGGSIRIEVADYSYGADELSYQNAWGKDVLVEIDDGVADGDESIDYYMTYLASGEKYIDILKRLNVPVVKGGEFDYPIPEIDELTIEGGDITSMLNRPVTEHSWWNILIQDLDDTSLRFCDQPAKKKSRLHLIYYNDADQDRYTDRIEKKIGTDPEDIDSHPSPILIAGKIIEEDGDNKTVKLKFTNVGNFDAYGIEAVLYSPDETTTVPGSNQIIGGGGRIEVGEIFIPDEELIYQVNGDEYAEPMVLIRYNDPQGSHTFITRLEIEDSDTDIARNAGDMLPAELKVQADEEYTFQQDNWLIVDYFNPSIPIQNANILVAYQDPNGVICYLDEKIVEVGDGHNSWVFWWNPSENLPKNVLGETYKAVIILSDYQEVEIAYDVVKFALTSHPSEKLATTFLEESAERTIALSAGGSQTEYIKLPKGTLVTDARLHIQGDTLESSFPDSLWLEVGEIDGNREWETGSFELQGQTVTLTQFENGSTTERLDLAVSNNKTLYVNIPHNAIITSACMKLRGEYDHSQFTNYTYDTCNDSSINMNLWDVSENDYYDAFNYSTVSESAYFLHFNVSGNDNGKPTYKAYARAINLPPIDILQSISFKMRRYGIGNGACWDVSLHCGFQAFGADMFDTQGNSGNPLSGYYWSLIRKEQAGSNIFDAYTQGEWQGEITAMNNEIEFFSEVHAHCSSGAIGVQGGVSGISYKTRSCPENPHIEVGVLDGDYEWSHSDRFADTTVQTNDFSSQINSYLKATSPDSNGFCKVPLLIHSDGKGELEVSDIEVVYNIAKTKDLSEPLNTAINNGDCDCEGCILEDDCCSVPLTFYSETPGILTLSDLRIIHEPTNLDKANLDGDDPIDLNDLSLFIEDYTETGPYLIGDINRDEKADILDMALIAEQWLKSCECN